MNPDKDYQPAIREWCQLNRIFLVFLGGVFIFIGVIYLLYFLYGHMWLRPYIETRSFPVFKAMAGDAISLESRFAMVDEMFRYGLFCAGALLVMVAIIIFRPPFPPQEFITKIFTGLFLAVIYLSLSQIVVFAAYLRPGFHNHSTISWNQVMSGEGHARVASRPLVPLLIRHLSRLIPLERQQEIRKNLQDSDLFLALSHRTMGLKPFEVEFAISIVIAIGAHFLLLWVIGSLAKTLYDVSDIHTRFLIPVAFSLMTPVLFHMTTYIYDMSNLSMITLGYFLIVKRRLFLFHLCFALAIWHKESFILTSFAFLVVLWDVMPWKKFLFSLILQATYFIGVKVYLAQHYGQLPGAVFHRELGNNLSWLLAHHFWYFIAEIDLTAYYFSLMYIPLALVVGLWKWRSKHPVLRRLFIAVFPVLLTVNFIMVVFYEWRAFYEVYPLLFLLIYETIGNGLDRVKHRQWVNVDDVVTIKLLITAKLNA